MATKAEHHRYWAERSGADKKPQRRRPRPDWGADTSLPGVSATDRKLWGRHSAKRNWNAKARRRKAVYALEDSAGKPSRKTTRASLNRIKASRPVRWTSRGGIYF